MDIFSIVSLLINYDIITCFDSIDSIVKRFVTHEILDKMNINA